MMWVAFRSVAPDQDDDFDEFMVVESEAEARGVLSLWEAKNETICAGIAPIADATDPHWLVAS